MILILRHTVLIFILCISGKPGHAQIEEDTESVSAFVSDQYLMPGETLWVKAAVSKGSAPSPSKILYLELLDREGIAVVQEMALLDNGESLAYLTIGDNLATDFYLLRVYTRISPYQSTTQGIHHELIAVINPSIPPKSVSEAHHTPTYETFRPVHELPITGIQEKILTAGNTPLTITLKDEVKGPAWIAVNFRGNLPRIPQLDFSNIYEQDQQQAIPEPEIFGHLIEGRTLRNKIDTAETFYLSAHGKNSKLMLGKPLPNGRVYFEASELHHFDYVVVQTEDQNEQLDFVINSPFWEKTPRKDFVLPTLSFSKDQIADLQDRLIAGQVGAYYQKSQELPTATHTEPITSDLTYLLDDYNRFDDMATVIREYVPTVLVRRDNRKIIFRNSHKPAGTVFRSNPLILIDEMPVFDSDAFAQFNPTGIRRMDILNRHYFLDHKSFEGLISLTSFDNDHGKFALPRTALFIAYPGVQMPKQPASSIGNSNAALRIPKLHPVVLWESLEKGETLRLDSDRLNGSYEIRIVDWGTVEKKTLRSMVTAEPK